MNKKDFPNPCNYSNYIKIDEVEYVYHGETEPHTHKGETKDDVWKVKFHWFCNKHRFVYRYGGKLHSIVPKLGEVYPFDCKKRHGVIKKEDVSKFNQRKYWNEKFPISHKPKRSPLACVFTFEW